MKKNNTIFISPADSSDRYFKGNVTSLIQELDKILDNEKSVESRIYSVHMKPETD